MSKEFDWPVEEMIRRYQSGWTCKEIGDWLGYKNQTISRVLRRHGCVMRKTGAPMERNYFWTGGRIVEKPEGYILVKNNDHPHANQRGYVREHRLVMEKMLGRYLTPEEVVHHKDGNRANNDPSNLVLYENNAAHLADELPTIQFHWKPETILRKRGQRKKPDGTRRWRTLDEIELIQNSDHSKDDNDKDQQSSS